MQYNGLGLKWHPQICLRNRQTDIFCTYGTKNRFLFFLPIFGPDGAGHPMQAFPDPLGAKYW